jgi:hypothetical protein
MADDTQLRIKLEQALATLLKTRGYAVEVIIDLPEAERLLKLLGDAQESES